MNLPSSWVGNRWPELTIYAGCGTDYLADNFCVEKMQKHGDFYSKGDIFHNHNFKRHILNRESFKCDKGNS